MKILVTNYTFNASAKTITFTDYVNIAQESILLITNVVDNIIIYNFANPALGGTVATNVLTLTYDTTTMSDTDALQIFYEDTTAAAVLPTGAATETTLAAVETKVGSLTETAPGTDTASSGLNGRLQRIAQNLTSLITALGSPFQAGGSIGNTTFGSDLRVGSAAVTTSNPVPIQPPLSGVLNISIDQTGNNNAVDVLTVPTDPFGANADAASATGSISAKLRAIATALGVTALDLGSGTAGTRTLRFFQDTAQFIGGTGPSTTATQRVTLATDIALPAGTNAIGKLAANSGVDIGDVDILSIVPGVGATNLGKAEDAIHGSGDTGVMALAVSNEANTARAADGDYLPIATDTEGNVRMVGNRDHDAVDAGETVKVGGKAVSSEPTAVAAADRANFITDLVGKQITLPYANPENFVSGAITTAMTGTTSTSLLAAPAAGLRNYITTIVVSNAHATVGTDVVIQDGSGGTTLLTIPAAYGYGGATITLPVPLRQPTTATAIYCANVTTGASTKVSAIGYKGI